MTRNSLLACLGLLAVAAPWALADTGGRSPVSTSHAVRAERALSHWADQGFVELVAPVLPAMRPNERVSVWMLLPEGARWEACWSARQRRWLPAYPAETRAARIDEVLEGGTWRIADVRGTTFLRGDEELEVLRLDPTEARRLVGFAWRRSDARGQRIASDELVELARLPRGAVADVFRSRNACAACHRHDKPARRIDTGGGLPIGPTDHGGLYATLDVLRDVSEVDDAGGRHVNVDQHVHMDCPSGQAPVVRDSCGGVQVSCAATNDVPSARYDLRAALRDGERHARAVCASRRYLFERAAASARRAFADAFAICGLR